MRRHLRRTLAAAAASSLLLALGACSEDEPSASDEPTTATSEPTESESTTEATPSEATPTEDEPTAGKSVDKGEFVDDMLAGLQRSTTAQMSMTSDFGGTGMEAEGEVDYTTTPVTMAMTISAGAISQEETELRLVDGIMYINLGSMSNGKFVRFDLNDPQSLPPGMSGIAGQMDPLAAFEEFEPALKSVTRVGTDEVDGDELDHYEVVLDTTKMKSLRKLPAAADLPPEVGYDLWFDDEFRMRRMEMVMDMAQPVTVEVELSEWGTPVDIEAPPARQVAQSPQA